MWEGEMNITPKEVDSDLMKTMFPAAVFTSESWVSFHEDGGQRIGGWVSAAVTGGTHNNCGLMRSSFGSIGQICIQ